MSGPEVAGDFFVALDEVQADRTDEDVASNKPEVERFLSFSVESHGFSDDGIDH